MWVAHNNESTSITQTLGINSSRKEHGLFIQNEEMGVWIDVLDPTVLSKKRTTFVSHLRCAFCASLLFGSRYGIAGSKTRRASRRVTGGVFFIGSFCRCRAFFEQLWVLTGSADKFQDFLVSHKLPSVGPFLYLKDVQCFFIWVFCPQLSRASRSSASGRSFVGSSSAIAELFTLNEYLHVTSSSH